MSDPHASPCWAPASACGGPTFEFLFGVDEQLKRKGRRDRFEIVFFNPSTEPARAQRAKYVLKAMGIKRLLDRT